MSNRYEIAAQALENLAMLARRRQPIRMATDGPREGDVNDSGLVFHKHRWRRKEDVSASEKAGGEKKPSIEALIADHNARGLNNEQRRPEVAAAGLNWKQYKRERYRVDAPSSTNNPPATKQLRRATLLQSIKDLSLKVSALDGGVDLKSVPTELRDQVDMFQAADPEASEIAELVAKARELVIDGSFDGVKAALTSVLSDRHADAWYRFQDEYQEEQRDIELKQWQDRNDNQQRVAQQIEDALPGANFTQAAGGSWYADYKGLKLRISDHSQVAGGGFNQSTGERMGESDLEIVVDHESSVNLSREKIRKQVSRKLRELKEDGYTKSERFTLSRYPKPPKITMATWTKYEGPRGGNGWRNTATGDVLYQDEMPGDGDTSKEQAAKPKKQTGGDGASLQPTREKPATIALHGTDNLQVAFDNGSWFFRRPGKGIESRFSDKSAGWVFAGGATRELILNTLAASQPKPEKQPVKQRTGPAIVHIDDISVDAPRFQYKIEGIGAGGVTQQFSDVDFNPELAGMLYVWHDPESDKTFVVNGHHRYQLAKRSGWKGELPVRFIDRKTATEARAFGALINIAEGAGTALDAAKFMRDTGMTGIEGLAYFKENHVSIKGQVAADSLKLANLSDKVFSELTYGRIPIGFAKAIGEELAPGAGSSQATKDAVFEAQNKLLGRIQKSKSRLSESVVREMALNASLAPKVAKGGGPQKSLFGDDEEEEILFEDRGRIQAAVRDSLTKDVRGFGAVSSAGREDLLRSAGVGDVDAQAASAKKSESEVIREMYDREIRFRGETGDKINSILNNAAKELHDATTKQDRSRAAKEAIARVRRLLAEAAKAEQATVATVGERSQADRATGPWIAAGLRTGGRRRVTPLIAMSKWVRYQGPRGGQGWKAGDTGEIVYQDEMPSGKQSSETESASPSKGSDSWFHGSKVVDDDGKPLVVYHGSNAQFDKFDIAKSSNKDIRGAFFGLRENLAGAFGKHVMRAHVNLKSPATFKDIVRLAKSGVPTRQIHRALMKEGFDGVFDKERGLVIAFNAKQIRLITENPSPAESGQSQDKNESRRLPSGLITPPGDFSTHFTGVSIDQTSRDRILAAVGGIPDGWTLKADHVTLHGGKASEGERGPQKLIATAVAKNDRTIAVMINGGRHLTLAVNSEVGAKAKESLDLTGFTKLKNPVVLNGEIHTQEVSKPVDNAAKAAAKAKALEATKHLADHQLIDALAKKDDPELYFNTDNAILFPVAKLTNIRARPEGIANAARFMYAAALGQMPKRGPVSVMNTPEGVKIFDGNSTFNIATQAGWKNLPVQFVDSEGKPFKDESQLEKLESELREIEDDLTGKTAKKKAREAAASVETLAMGLRANPVAVHRLPPRTYAVVATALERLIGATRMSLDRQVRQSLRLKSRPPIGPETYRTLARVFERLIPPVQMALDNRRPITMAVKQTWTPFTTKSGKTGAYNAASGKRLYGSEAEKALAQKKQSAPEEQAGRRRGAKPDEAKSRRQAKPEGTKKFRNVAEAEKHVREKLPEFAKKQGKTPPELAKSMGFKDEEQMIKTSAASKAAGFKSLEEASAAKKVPIGDKLTEALDAGDKPKAKEPFVETPEQIAKQGELQVNELPRIDMPQLYDQAKIDFIAKLKKKGVRVQDQDIPASKLTGLQSEYKPDKVHGIAGAMSAGAKIGGGRALVTSDGYVIDGHHRWRASHQADKPVECTVIDMPAHQLIDQMHRYDKAERRTVNEVLVSKQTGFGNKMANYLHGKLDPVMQEAFKPSDYRLPVNKVQPFQSEDEVIEVAKQNEEDYHRILNMGLGVSKALGATAVDARVDGAFMDLLNKVDAGQLEGPFVLIAPLKTASEKGLKRAREKVEKNYDGDWGQLKDVVRGTIAVDKYDDIPAAVKALREHVQSRGWTLSMRPESRFANPTPAGYRDIQLFIESPDGMQCEVQVNTKAMWVAKEKYGHKMYEESRSLKGETDEERARIAELDKQMSDLYTKAWDASKGDQFD